MKVNISKRKLILTGILLILTIGVTLLRVDVPSITRPLGEKSRVDAGVYATLGDLVIYPAVILLGGPFGAAVSAVGAAVADVIVAAIRGTTSARYYIIGSILIKGGMAFFLARFLSVCEDWRHCIGTAALTEALMVAGYLVYDVLIVREFGVAWRDMLVNLAQGVVCAGGGAVILKFLLPAVRPKSKRKKPKQEDLGVWN